MPPTLYNSQNRAGRIFRDFREHPRKDPRGPRLGHKLSRAQWVAKYGELNWSTDILRAVEEGQPPLSESRLKDLVTFGVLKETDPFFTLLVYAASLDWQEHNNPDQQTKPIALEITELEEVIDAEVRLVEPEVIERIVERIIEKEVIKEVPVEVIKEVEKIIEKPVEVIKEVVVEKEKVVEKPVVVTKVIEKVVPTGVDPWAVGVPQVDTKMFGVYLMFAGMGLAGLEVWLSTTGGGSDVLCGVGAILLFVGVALTSTAKSES